MTTYAIVREETPAANLVGNHPTPLASNLALGAHLLERTRDQRLFLLIGATTDSAQARAWAATVLERVDQ